MNKQHPIPVGRARLAMQLTMHVLCISARELIAAWIEPTRSFLGASEGLQSYHTIRIAA